MISYVSLKYGPKHLGAVVAHSNDKTFLWYSKIGILSDMGVPPKLTLLYFGDPPCMEIPVTVLYRYMPRQSHQPLWSNL